MDNFKSQEHLINIILQTRNESPNYCLFLGAGASVSSGISSAGKLIECWREQAERMYKDSPTELGKIKKVESTPEEYSRLFELLYDEPSQRRDFIEKHIKCATPSIGYVYLTNLISKRIFNTIFTTNFDDLINESCYSFSNDTRPLVCSHDSSIRFIRISSDRPKIIKLHGDYLYDNIKNTVKELESLEENTKDKFRHFAAEYGFIFLGYAGNDRSVMDILEILLKNDSFFPHGIYWCVRRGVTEKDLSEPVDRLRRHPKFRIVEIDGFDEFMATLNRRLDIPLQEEIISPFDALRNKLNTLINENSLKSKCDVIRDDVALIGKSIEGYKSNPTSGQVAAGDDPLIPYLMLSQINEKDSTLATKFIKAELRIRKTAPAVHHAFKVLGEAWDSDLYNQAKQALCAGATELKGNIGVYNNAIVAALRSSKLNEAEELIALGEEALKHSSSTAADLINREFFIINKAQIKLRKGETLAVDEISSIEIIKNNSTSAHSRLGASIVLKDAIAIENNCALITELQNPPIQEVLRWPIFELVDVELKTKLLEMLKNPPSRKMQK